MLESKKANWQWRYIQQVLRLASVTRLPISNLPNQLQKSPKLKGGLVRLQMM